MIFCGILALSIFFGNLTVIIVIIRNPQFPTNQMIYKLSLAFADILIGIFLVPSFVISLYISNIGPYQRHKIISNFTNTNKTVNEFDEVHWHNVNSYYMLNVPKAYIHLFGFINTLSLFNSIYILMFASIDRFIAVHNPLSYDKDKAVTVAKLVVIFMWVVWTVYAAIPIFVPQFGSYEILAGGIMIAVKGEVSFYACSIGLLLPFFVMWIFTIWVQVSVKSQLKAGKKLVSTKRKRSFSVKRQLSVTLSIMIGVFSVCILPAVMLIVISEIFPEFNPLNVNRFSIKSAFALGSAELVSSILLVSNSLWNVFIYSIRNKEFRKDASALYFTTLSTLVEKIR